MLRIRHNMLPGTCVVAQLSDNEKEGRSVAQNVFTKAVGWQTTPYVVRTQAQGRTPDVRRPEMIWQGQAPS